jgi:outer membrane protein assembly factor BamB
LLVLLATNVRVTSASFFDAENLAGNTFRGWSSTQWAQTSQTDFNAGILNQVDTAMNPGHVRLAVTSGHDQILTVRGTSTNFYKFDVINNTWSPPLITGAGSAITFDNSRYIYALQGGTATGFWRLDITDNTWVGLTGTPSNVAIGGALAYGGSNYIYAFRGGTTTTFWRYDMIANSWSAMAVAPANVATGGALAWDGSSYVYALRGGTTTAFWRYDIVANSWTAMAVTPNNVGAGGALVYDGSSNVYALQGGSSTAFWRYSIASNSWTTLAVTAANVVAGGALTYDGLSNIYAFQGGSTAFWKYDIETNSWTTLSPAPASISAGGALSIVKKATHSNSGNVASRVLDTGIGASRWDALFWDRDLQTSTSITFEVRSSDTLFVANDSSPAWIGVGGVSPLNTGLPSGRYKQWRATLTTSDTLKTPSLNEVRIYYH